MTDLISRAEMLEALGHFNDYVNGDPHFLNGIETAKEITENLPAVDAVPVVHGMWIEVDEGDGDYTYDCSVCGGKWWLAADTPEANGMKYCPYCGAKMDGERRDDE